MIIVLDTSAAIEIVLQRPQAINLSNKLIAADWVIAPKLLIAEASNVFWKYHKQAGYPAKDCEKYAKQAISLVDNMIDEIDYYQEALHLGCRLNHSIYDMLYLILARRNNASLLTMDKKLISLANQIDVEAS